MVSFSCSCSLLGNLTSSQWDNAVTRRRIVGNWRPDKTPVSDGLAVTVGPGGLASPASNSATVVGPLVFVDPRPLTRKSFADMLTKGLPDYVVEAVANCQEINLPGKSQAAPGMVLLNAGPGRVGRGWTHGAVQWLQQRLPEAPVIILSDEDDGAGIDEFLALGVRGFLLTTVDPEVAFAAVRLVYAGGTYVPAPFIRQMLRREAAPLSMQNPRQTELPSGSGLTPREMAVANLVRQGKPNKVIGIELGLEESTVKVHLRNIMRKLHAANRTQVALVADHLFARDADK
jgi:DNA-binding NarL/FixJ family response regulator